MSSQQIGEARRSKRPPAIPDDVADPAVVKATGRVSLPTRVRWSAPARSYDLADRRQRARVYEQVLGEVADVAGTGHGDAQQRYGGHAGRGDGRDLLSR
jgi:hypothetical protein